jgi:hypothetical protein
VAETWVLHGEYRVEAPASKDPQLPSETMMAWWRLIRTQMKGK